MGFSPYCPFPFLQHNHLFSNRSPASFIHLIKKEGSQALFVGWVRTAMTKGWDEDKAFNKKLKTATPMHRAAEPEEISGIILFLCSRAASDITGQTYAVEGGQTIRGLFPSKKNSSRIAAKGRYHGTLMYFCPMS
ncbi:MAG: SDR family oxidoreductase [Nostoc sp.]